MSDRYLLIKNLVTVSLYGGQILKEFNTTQYYILMLWKQFPPLPYP